MDANALKKLSRKEIQKLAQREKIKANAKTIVIIDQLVEKYPEGVPGLSSVTRESSKAKEQEVATEVRVVKAQSENTNTTAAQTQTKEDGSGAMTIKMPDAATLPVSSAGSDLLPVSPTHNKREPTKLNASKSSKPIEQREAEPTVRREVGSQVSATRHNKRTSSKVGRPAAPSTRTSPIRAPYVVVGSSGRPADGQGALPTPEGGHTAEAAVQHARESEEGRKDSTEERVMLLRRRLAEHMRVAKHWGRVLGETTTILGACNTKNQEVSKRKEEVVVRREEIENSYKRLRDSKRKAEEDKEEEDVSEDQDTSDFVATSDSSSDSPFDGDADPIRALQAVCRGKPVFFRGQYFPGDGEK
ncbi:hypothetical protein BDY19DRAFT_1050042 [Irpex rosettiformis]|uniref:Uncharacterized protein n=1 Tax=Irpex rosettiformis TaxID=378272 RepID=A0ACB8TWI0_9APHY|nr:hypothetical protein BDY19DRAFT_1050042 [Irpex rosettiformis]